MNISRNIGRFAALAATASLLAPSASFAISPPSLTALETVANVAVGTNNQTLATSSSVSNVAQVKATRTITVNSAPTVPVVLTIGSCAITITSSVASDVDCSNNTAAIATSTDTTAAAIASRIRSITSLSDNTNGHGALTIGGSSATASFTTTGTEASSTAIFATLSTGSDVTLTTVNTSGTVPVAQVWTATPANVQIADVFTAIINGTTITYTATAATVANVTAGLTAAINASAQASAVTAVDGTTLVTVTSDTAGTAFTLTASAADHSAVAQTVTFTPTDPGTNDKFNVSINSTAYAYTSISGDTVKDVVEGLVAQMASDTAVTCTEDDIKVTCVAQVAGTAFTYSANISSGSAPSASRHSGGGGGSSHSSSSSSSTIGGNMTTTTTTTSGSVGINPSAFANLTVGATGIQVSGLQTWLLAKGYSIPAGATGYFGAQTKAAVAAFQAASGISPAVGFFGPLTRAYIAAHL